LAPRQEGNGAVCVSTAAATRGWVGPAGEFRADAVEDPRVAPGIFSRVPARCPSV